MPVTPEIVPEVYVVRADSGRWADAFRRGGYVAISYGPVKNVPLYKALEVGKEFVREVYEELYPDASPMSVAQNTGQIWRFLNDLKPGMIVMVPTEDTAKIMVGQVTEDYYYEADPPDGDCPWRHRKRVAWRSEPLYRNSFSVPLQQTLASSLAIFNVRQVEEILAALDLPVPEAKKPLLLTEASLAHLIIERILELTPDEFEILVTELLSAIGFESEHVGKSGDNGIDVQGKLDVYGFANVDLMVQVKRYRPGATIDHKIIKSFRGSVPDRCQAAFVTTANFTAKAREEALRPGYKRIGLINGAQLVDLLTEHYDDLSPELKEKLHLRMTLIPE